MRVVIATLVATCSRRTYARCSRAQRKENAARERFTELAPMRRSPDARDGHECELDARPDCSL